jgi:hypothetical protein
MPAYAAETQPAPSQPEPVAVEVQADTPPEPVPAKPAPKITGTYSTLKSIGGDDDMVGMEVIIVRSREGYRAFVQTADGIPAPPALVTVQVEGPTLSFTVPSTSGEPLQFKGKASRQGLTGTLGDHPVALPRRRSYWQ